MKRSQLTKTIAAAAICGLFAGSIALAGCSSNPPASSNSSSTNSPSTTTNAAKSTERQIDYKVLVNKQHQLPEWWEDSLETVTVKNSEGTDVVVEKKAYDAYTELKADLEKEGVTVDLDSAYRPVADQQRIWNEFMDEYGEEYTKTHVAVPGYSEHQTGLALDLYLIINGKEVDENEDMMKYPEIWSKIHSKLAEHGFILRYLDGQDDVTGYAYEPWHIRYIDDAAVAKETMDKNITFEEYLGLADEAREANAKAKAEEEAAKTYKIDYGTSELYTKNDVDIAIAKVMKEFGTWKGTVMKEIKYAGDEASKAALESCNATWKKDGAPDYAEAICFTSTFTAPTGDDAKNTAWEPGKDYEDYTWYLARTADGSWELLSWGYN